MWGNGLRRPVTQTARALRRAFRATSPATTYLGVALVVAGFAVLVVAWGGVAGTLYIPLQLPYLASGGFGGFAILSTGLALLNIGAKRRDAALRERSLAALSEAVRARTVEPSDMR